MMNTFEHNKNLLKSINTFNLLEKTRYNAPRDKKQITNLNPTIRPPKQIHHKIIDNDKINNPYKGIAHIDYVKKDTPPYYGLHETGSRSISYNDFFKVK
jgi:hypothetical protein